MTLTSTPIRGKGEPRAVHRRAAVLPELVVDDDALVLRGAARRLAPDHVVRAQVPRAEHLVGFGRIVVSQTEALNLFFGYKSGVKRVHGRAK